MTANTHRQALGNATALTAGSVAEALLQFAFVLLVSRQLGPEDYGFYEYLVGIVTFLVAIVQWGLPVVTVRELAQAPERFHTIFGASFRITAMLAALCFAGGVSAAVFSGTTPERSTAIWLLFLFVIFLPFHLSAVFDAHKLSRWDVPGRIIGRLASVLLLFLLWRWRGTLTVADAALCASLSMAVTVLISWRVAGHVGVKPRLSVAYDAGGEVRAEIRRLFKLAAPIAWTNVMSTVYSFSQPVLVKWYSTDLQTGWFGLANRLMLPWLLIKGVLYRLMLPLLSEIGHDRAAFEWRFSRVVVALALFFMPLVVLAIPLVEMLVIPVFGVAYIGSILPLQILIGHMFLTGTGSIFATALFSLGYQKTYTWSLTLACASFLLSSALLIPPYGALGAAGATAIAEILANVIALPVLLRVLTIRVWGRLTRIALICLTALGVYFILTRGFAVSPLLAFSAELLALIGSLWLGGELSRERIMGIVELVRRKA